MKTVKCGDDPTDTHRQTDRQTDRHTHTHTHLAVQGSAVSIHRPWYTPPVVEGMEHQDTGNSQWTPQASAALATNYADKTAERKESLLTTQSKHGPMYIVGIHTVTVCLECTVHVHTQNYCM